MVVAENKSDRACSVYFARMRLAEASVFVFYIEGLPRPRWWFAIVFKGFPPSSRRLRKSGQGGPSAFNASPIPAACVVASWRRPIATTMQSPRRNGELSSTCRGWSSAALSPRGVVAIVAVGDGDPGREVTNRQSAVEAPGNVARSGIIVQFRDRRHCRLRLDAPDIPSFSFR